MEDKVKLTWEGKERKVFIIPTRRTVLLKKGEIEVTKEEAEVLLNDKKSRIAKFFKEFKPEKKEVKKGGDVNG